MQDIQGKQSIIIEAPVSTVYRYVCDFPRHTEWNHQPTKITKLTDGPITVGTVFRAEERAPDKAPWFIKHIMLPLMWKFVGMKGYTDATITGMEENQCLSWKAEAPARNGSYMEAEWDIHLESESDTVTKLTQHYIYIPKRQFMGGMREKMSEQINEEVGANLEVLKTKLETTRSS